jgi:hypothetical protein
MWKMAMLSVGEENKDMQNIVNCFPFMGAVLEIFSVKKRMGEQNI